MAPLCLAAVHHYSHNCISQSGRCALLNIPATYPIGNVHLVILVEHHYSHPGTTPVLDQEDQYTVGLYFSSAMCASQLRFMWMIYRCVTEISRYNTSVKTVIKLGTTAGQPMGDVLKASVNPINRKGRVQ
jgi:hypothetical protein